MHWHRPRSQIHQVFQVTSHMCWDFRSVLRVVNSICRSTNLFNFWPVREFLVEIHTAKSGLLRCCLYTQRRLQQTTVSCKRSNCKKKKREQQKIVKVARLRYYPKTANNEFLRSIMSLCMYPHSSTFLGITPLPPTGGRTRWLVPLLILPEWHWPEFSLSKFLV